jgi:hypothetical protein
MINSYDVVFYKNIFKVSNEHTTITTLSYVRSDTVFMNNSTSDQSDDIEDYLVNWTFQVSKSSLQPVRRRSNITQDL